MFLISDIIPTFLDSLNLHTVNTVTKQKQANVQILFNKMHLSIKGCFEIDWIVSNFLVDILIPRGAFTPKTPQLELYMYQIQKLSKDGIINSFNCS